MNNEEDLKPSISSTWKPAKFAKLDQVDWLIILVSVLLATLVKQHHWLDVPNWFMDWIVPFLLMILGVKSRTGVTRAICRGK